ncbi:hypothetical protein ES703_12183 [subsurface metagenome]
MEPQNAAQRVTIYIQDILPPKKAAEYLAITTMTLWRWVRDGKITPVMLDHSYFHITELKRVKLEADHVKALKALKEQTANEAHKT